METFLPDVTGYWRFVHFLLLSFIILCIGWVILAIFGAFGTNEGEVAIVLGSAVIAGWMASVLGLLSKIVANLQLVVVWTEEERMTKKKGSVPER